MKISTFSIVVGTKSCDASCPFCISHSTGFEQVSNKDIRWDSFNRAVGMARNARTITLLLTGKGEPTLYPDEISLYLKALYQLSAKSVLNVDDGEQVELVDPVFPIMELQTNAIRIGKSIANKSLDYNENKLLRQLEEWKSLGLSTIAISTVGIKNEHNKRVYLNHRNVEYPDLSATVLYLKTLGFNVRICVMMQQGMVSQPKDVLEVVDWCRSNKVDQLTFRPIRRPKNKLPVLQNETDRYVIQYGLEESQELLIEQWIKKTGQHIFTFSTGDHEAKVYDINGQNVCLTDCLTVSVSPDTIRTLILYPRSGEIAYHWDYNSAKL